MFKNLLVPLDGSTLAESILPAARALGAKLPAQVTLLHVVEPGVRGTIHGDKHLSNSAEAEVYLQRIAEQFRRDGIAVNWHVDVVERGKVAKAIFAHTGELHADLVLLCTHGENGLRSVVFGSIAQQVVQSGQVPVLVARPEGMHATFAPRQILAPLDGSALYEPALYLAADLTRAFAARLHLVVVVPTISTLTPERAATGSLLPTSTKAILDLAQNGAVEYLQSRVQELQAQGLTITAEVERGNSAAKILEVATRIEADLLVMATHGRAGLDAFWQGSVAPQVLNHVQAPVLLLRVVGPEPPR